MLVGHFLLNHKNLIEKGKCHEYLRSNFDMVETSIYGINAYLIAILRMPVFIVIDIDLPLLVYGNDIT